MLGYDLVMPWSRTLRRSSPTPAARTIEFERMRDGAIARRLAETVRKRKAAVSRSATAEELAAIDGELDALATAILGD